MQLGILDWMLEQEKKKDISAKTSEIQIKSKFSLKTNKSKQRKPLIWYKKPFLSI